jgi:hypothetical protein
MPNWTPLDYNPYRANRRVAACRQNIIVTKNVTGKVKKDGGTDIQLVENADTKT